MTTASEKHWMDRVAQLPCCTCGDWPVQLHHVREGQGMSQRASNYLVVPLCPPCHTGPSGFHGNKAMMKIKKWDEMDMLADTIKRLVD